MSSVSMLSLFLEMPYLLTNPKHTEMKNKKCQNDKRVIALLYIIANVTK